MQIIKFHLVDIGVVEGCVYFIQNKEWCRLVARHSIWKDERELLRNTSHYKLLSLLLSLTVWIAGDKRGDKHESTQLVIKLGTQKYTTQASG